MSFVLIKNMAKPLKLMSLTIQLPMISNAGILVTNGSRRMFSITWGKVFKIKPEDQQYQLDVFEKVNDTFNLKLEMKKFANNKAVIDNFRRQGHVPGGCCVKFYRKLL